jgi:hypothetical protein
MWYKGSKAHLNEIDQKFVEKTIEKNLPKIRKFLGIKHQIYRIYGIENAGYTAKCRSHKWIEFNTKFFAPGRLGNLWYFKKHREEIDTWEKAIIFVATHELRHVVQFRDNMVSESRPMVFWQGKKYRLTPRKLCTGRIYNSLPWEADANAHALEYIKSLGD